MRSRIEQLMPNTSTIIVPKELESWTTIVTIMSSSRVSTSPSVSKTAARRMCPENHTAEAQCRVKTKTGTYSWRRPLALKGSRVSLFRVLDAICLASTPPEICHPSRGTSLPNVWPWATFPSTMLLSRMIPNVTKTCLSPVHYRTSSWTQRARTGETNSRHSTDQIHLHFNLCSRNYVSKINP